MQTPVNKKAKAEESGENAFKKQKQVDGSITVSTSLGFIESKINSSNGGVMHDKELV